MYGEGSQALGRTSQCRELERALFGSVSRGEEHKICSTELQSSKHIRHMRRRHHTTLGTDRVMLAMHITMGTIPPYPLQSRHMLGDARPRGLES
jgi:hypothetical protein